MALVPFPGSQSQALEIPPDDDEPVGPGGRMSFLDHLEELRKRIIRACLGVLLGIVLCIYWIREIVQFLLEPARRVLPEGAALVANQPGEGFSVSVVVSLIAGGIVASPYIMWQVWKFIAPGLYANEKRFAIPFVVMSTTGFLGGAAFNHYIAFPSLMAFFAGFTEWLDLLYLPTTRLVFGLYVKMLIGLGLVFQMPTVVFFLAKMGLVTAQFLISQFRHAFLIFVIVAALITPTSDPLNLAIFTAPMVVLYGLSICIAWAVRPARRQDGDSDAS